MMHKYIFGTAGILAIVVAFMVSSRVYANNSFKNNDRPDVNHFRNDNLNRIFNPSHELSRTACGNNLGKPVIDASQRIQNDADSGVAGDYWAFDYYTKHITVWATATADTYCAVVTYNGKFYTVPGQIGPGDDPAGAQINTNTSEPVNGDMSGGYRATITGTLSATPLWATHGFIGTINYQCDINANCPGKISWTDQYFSSSSFSYDWWGWKYNAGKHGSWINSSDGNTGNIL